MKPWCSYKSKIIQIFLYNLTYLMGWPLLKRRNHESLVNRQNSFLTCLIYLYYSPDSVWSSVSCFSLFMCLTLPLTSLVAILLMLLCKWNNNLIPTQLVKSSISIVTEYLYIILRKKNNLKNSTCYNTRVPRLYDTSIWPHKVLLRRSCFNL